MAALAAMLVPLAVPLAQEAVVGEVVIGETGYEVPVEVVNRGGAPITGITVEVTATPPGLTNFKVTPSRVDSLAAGETAIFGVTFDVAKDAVPADFAEIGFHIAAPGVEFDNPEPRLAVAIVGGGDEGEAVAEDYPVVYRLVRVSGPSEEDPGPRRSADCTDDFKPGTAGGTVRCEWSGRNIEKAAVTLRFTEFPLEIMPGQREFEIKAEVIWRPVFAEGLPCLTPVEQVAGRQRCLTGGMRAWQRDRPIVAGDDGAARFTLRYRLDESDRVQGRYFYAYTGTWKLPGAPRGILFEPRDTMVTDERGFIVDFKESDESVKRRDIAALKGFTDDRWVEKIDLRTSQGFIALYYRPVLAGGDYLENVAQYEVPRDVLAGPKVASVEKESGKKKGDEDVAESDGDSGAAGTARQQANLRDSSAALESCDIGAIRRAEVKLAAGEAGVGEPALAALAKLRREIAADGSFAKAGKAYAAGDLDAAEGHLAMAKATSCAERHAHIAGRLKKIARLRGVLAKTDSAIAACEPGTLRRYGARLEGSSHVLLVQARARVEAASGPLTQAIAANDAAKAAYSKGDLGSAESKLGAARRSLNGIGPKACPALRQAIAKSLEKTAKLRRVLAKVDQAIGGCDLPAIRNMQSQLAGQRRGLLAHASERLVDAEADCAARIAETKRRRAAAEAAEAAERERRDRAALEAEARQWCGNTYANSEPTKIDYANRRWECGCGVGFVLASDGQSCVEPTTRQVEPGGGRAGPTTRESCIIMSGYGGFNIPNAVFILLRMRQARPDGSRDYRFAVADPTVPVYVERAHKDMNARAIKHNGEIVVDGSRRQFCAYLEQHCAKWFGIGRLRKSCGYDEQQPGQPAAVEKDLRQAKCAGVLGSWAWPRKTTATFSGGPNGGSASVVGNPLVSAGTWSCIGPGKIRINWNNGKYIDTMTLSGDTLSGSNQTGYSFSSSRLK